MSIARVNSIVDSAGGNTATINGKLPIAAADVPALSTGMTLLGTLTTTSGAAQTLSGLDLTGYKALWAAVEGVSFDTTGRKLRIDGVACSAALGAATDTLYGLIQLSLLSGTGTSYVPIINTPSTSNSSAGAGYALRTGITQASTSVAFTLDGAGNFDAGSIVVYGVK